MAVGDVRAPRRSRRADAEAAPEAEGTDLIVVAPATKGKTRRSKSAADGATPEETVRVVVLPAPDAQADGVGADGAAEAAAPEASDTETAPTAPTAPTTRGGRVRRLQRWQIRNRTARLPEHLRVITPDGVLPEGYEADAGKRFAFAQGSNTDVLRKEEETLRYLREARERNTIINGTVIQYLNDEEEFLVNCGTVEYPVIGIISRENFDVSHHRWRSEAQFVGTRISCTVVSVSEDGSDITLSRIGALRRMQQVTWHAIEPGAIVPARVRSFSRDQRTVILDIGGIPAILPDREIPKNPETGKGETFARDDQMDVMVIRKRATELVDGVEYSVIVSLRPIMAPALSSSAFKLREKMRPEDPAVVIIDRAFGRGRYLARTILGHHVTVTGHVRLHVPIGEGKRTRPVDVPVQYREHAQASVIVKALDATSISCVPRVVVTAEERSAIEAAALANKPIPALIR